VDGDGVGEVVHHEQLILRLGSDRGQQPAEESEEHSKV